VRARDELEPLEDDEGAALVRPYALVRGRTRTEAMSGLPVEAIVETTESGASTRLALEKGAILRRCMEPCSVVEISAHLDVPIGVARVLVGDLMRMDAVIVHLPVPGHLADGRVDRVLLERVLAGLEAL
jgi:hypothetical protein